MTVSNITMAYQCSKVVEYNSQLFAVFQEHGLLFTLPFHTYMYNLGQNLSVELVSCITFTNMYFFLCLISNQTTFIYLCNISQVSDFAFHNKQQFIQHPPLRAGFTNNGQITGLLNSSYF